LSHEGGLTDGLGGSSQDRACKARNTARRCETRKTAQRKRKRVTRGGFVVGRLEKGPRNQTSPTTGRQHAMASPAAELWFCIQAVLRQGCKTGLCQCRHYCGSIGKNVVSSGGTEVSDERVATTLRWPKVAASVPEPCSTFLVAATSGSLEPQNSSGTLGKLKLVQPQPSEESRIASVRAVCR
jgi:hypothetical protein